MCTVFTVVNISKAAAPHMCVLVIEMSWGPYQKYIIPAGFTEGLGFCRWSGRSHAAYVHRPQLLAVPMTSGALAWQGCGWGPSRHHLHSHRVPRRWRSCVQKAGLMAIKERDDQVFSQIGFKTLDTWKESRSCAVIWEDHILRWCVHARECVCVCVWKSKYFYYNHAMLPRIT